MLFTYFDRCGENLIYEIQLLNYLNLVKDTESVATDKNIFHDR